jgi:hypothetical protein
VGEVTIRQGVAVLPPGVTDLALVDALQRRHVRAAERLVDLIELRVVRHLLGHVLALGEVQAVPLLTWRKQGVGSLAMFQW